MGPAGPLKRSLTSRRHSPTVDGAYCSRVARPPKTSASGSRTRRRSTREDHVARLYNRNRDLRIGGKKVYRRAGRESKWFYNKLDGTFELVVDETIATFDDAEAIAEDAIAYPRTESELGDFDGWTTVKASFVPCLEFDDCRGGLLIIYKHGFTMARSVTSIGSNKRACLVDGNFMCDCAARITDLSSLDPENFKFRNTEFLTGDSHYDMQPHETRQKLRRQIWVVRNGDLRRILDEFPTDKPLIEQCALWMHAVVGKHFFPDANHRTAIALLRRLLRENGIDPGNWPAERTRIARDESHEVRRELPQIRFDTMYEHDALYEVWERYFEDVLKIDCDNGD